MNSTVKYVNYFFEYIYSQKTCQPTCHIYVNTFFSFSFFDLIQLFGKINMHVSHVVFTLFSCHFQN